MMKNTNMSKEDAGHDNGCKEEKKEGLDTLFLRNWPSRILMDLFDHVSLATKGANAFFWSEFFQL